MSEWYVVNEGTNIRWCFDTKNNSPKVFDTEQIAQREIDRIKKNMTSEVKRVAISAGEYDEKYSKFITSIGEDDA